MLFLALFLFTSCSDDFGKKSHLITNMQKVVTTKLTPQDKRLELETNKPYVLFFFSTTCAACKEAVPYLNALQERYEDSLEIIGVMSGSKGLDSDIKFLNSQNIHFGVISEGKSVDYLSRAVGGIYGVPVFYLYDKEGNLNKRYLGLVPQNTLQDGIKGIL